MNWPSKRVLVTGAGGFIGSHLAERLVELGADVRALVHYNSLGSWGWLDESPLKERMHVVAGDICDQAHLRDAMQDRQIVFHLAALVAIPYSYRAPASYMRANVEGTLNVLEAARLLGVERLIHTSTSEVYGSALRIPIDERHALQAQSPYAASKIAADKLAESFYRSFDLPVVTLRPFNTFGPRQSARAVIPTIITQCLRLETVRLGNLSAIRDVNYVANTIDGFVLAAQSAHAIGQTIHVGSGQGVSIGQLARRIAELVGCRVRIESDPERLRPAKSEVERLVADNSRAKSLLGWEPAVSLEDGLIRTIQWTGENLSRYRADVYNV